MVDGRVRDKNPRQKKTPKSWSHLELFGYDWTGSDAVWRHCQRLNDDLSRRKHDRLLVHVSRSPTAADGLEGVGRRAVDSEVDV